MEIRLKISLPPPGRSRFVKYANAPRPLLHLTEYMAHFYDARSSQFSPDHPIPSLVLSSSFHRSRRTVSVLRFLLFQPSITRKSLSTGGNDVPRSFSFSRAIGYTRNTHRVNPVCVPNFTASVK